MAEKSPKRIPAKGKKLAKQQTSSKPPQKDKRLDKTAGSYHTGMKDVLVEVYNLMNKGEAKAADEYEDNFLGLKSAKEPRG